MNAIIDARQKMNPGRYLPALILRAILIVALLAVLGAQSHVLVAHAAPLSKATIASRLDTYLTKMTTTQYFRGAVLVARNGKVLFQKGYGYETTAQHIRNTTQTRFRLASVTKQFTAMAILLLQESGKLKVSDRICTYISPCPETWQNITINQVLTHTAGLPDLGEIAGWSWTRYWSPDEIIARAAEMPLVAPPGGGYYYSNTGYAILGRIVEKASGQAYASFLQKRILGPLGMTHSGLAFDGIAVPHLATGYRGIKPADPYNRSAMYAFGGMYSTVGDLLRWDLAIAGGKLATPASRAAMFTPAITVSDLGSYGYGWFISAIANTHRAYWHGGGLPGVSTFNGILPDDRLEVIVLSNNGEYDTLTMAQALTTIVVG